MSPRRKNESTPGEKLELSRFSPGENEYYLIQSFLNSFYLPLSTKIFIFSFRPDRMNTIMGKHTQLTHKDHSPGLDKIPLLFLLDDVEDPLNVGSLFRLADALGVSSLLLSGTTSVPPNKQIRKTSRSCENNVPWLSIPQKENAWKYLKENRYSVISVELTNLSKDLGTINFSSFSPLCLVAGSENKGVSQFWLDHSDEVIHIPMRGINSSMNVASAIAITAYTAASQFDTL